MGFTLLYVVVQEVAEQARIGVLYQLNLHIQTHFSTWCTRYKKHKCVCCNSLVCIYVRTLRICVYMWLLCRRMFRVNKRVHVCVGVCAHVCGLYVHVGVMCVCISVPVCTSVMCVCMCCTGSSHIFVIPDVYTIQEHL